MFIACLIFVLVSCVYSSVEKTNTYVKTELDFFVNIRSFIFISGWPQSGTSFLHQVFTLNPMISSMVENCEKVLGKRCINWNHEGQWLIPGHARNVLNSGVMCPHDGNITQTEAYALLSEWKPYWAGDKVYMVEKSPHSMLKIPLLRRVFAGAISTKFIILVKHPVTLNVATPRDFGWLYLDDKPSPFQVTNAKDRSPSKKLSFPQTCDVMQFFLDLMQHDNSTLYDHRSPRCSMGWLPAMTALTKQLRADPRSTRDVRIVRFESFQAPLKVCMDLFHFVFDFQSNTTTKLCNRYFGSTQRTSTITNTATASSAQLPLASNSKGAKRTSRLNNIHLNNIAKNVPNSRNNLYSLDDLEIPNKSGALVLLPGQTGRTSKLPPIIDSAKKHSSNNAKRRILHTKDAPEIVMPSKHGNASMSDITSSDERLDYSNGNSNAGRRQLRLRSSQESAETFSFIPELVSERSRQRVREFVAAYNLLGPSMKAKVDVLNRQLKSFGYNLFLWPGTADAATSLFSKWDIAEQ